MELLEEMLEAVVMQVQLLLLEAYEKCLVFFMELVICKSMFMYVWNLLYLNWQAMHENLCDV